MKRLNVTIYVFTLPLLLTRCAGSVTELFFSKMNAAAVLSLSGADFGSLQAWQSTTKQITLSNSGTATAKNISINLGSIYGIYSFNGGSYPGTAGTCGSTLAPGESCVLDIQFTPHAYGSQVAQPTISFVDTSARSTSVQLTGHGTETAFAVPQTQAGFDADVWSIVPLQDGSAKVYVAGEFTSCQGHSAAHIARLNPDGSLDNTFSVGTGPSDRLWSIALDTGLNQLYAFGDFATFNGVNQPYIVRLKYDGSVDTGFAPAGANLTCVNGDQSYNMYGHSLIAPLNDGSGKIYVGGSSCQLPPSHPNNTLVRLNSDGSLDAGFSPASFGYTTAIAIAKDGTGDIYVGGHDYGMGAGLVRLTSTGAVDGTWTTGIQSDSPSQIVALSDGSILVVGPQYLQMEVAPFTRTLINGIVKLTSSGAIDSSFHTGNGFPSSYYGSLFYGVMPVISIVPINGGTSGYFVTGQFSSYNGTAVNGIVQLNADGTVNPTLQTYFEPWSFSNDLDVTAFSFFNNFGGTIITAALATDGSGDIWIGGAFGEYQGKGANNLIKVTAQGAPTGGAQVSALWGTTNGIIPTYDGSGRIYVWGQYDSYKGQLLATPYTCAGNSTVPQQFLRLNYDGSLDGSFNIARPVTNTITGIAQTSTGKFYVSGVNCDSSASFLRLNSDGTKDTTFSATQGNWPLCTPISDGIGHIYLMGGCTINGVAIPGLARLNESSGSYDTGFVVGTGFTGGSVVSILPGSDGSVYAVGTFTGYNGTPVGGIVHLLSNGSIDPKFSTGSGFTWPAGGGKALIMPVSDGSSAVYVAGNFTQYQGTSVNFLVRLTNTGALDTSLTLDPIISSIIAGYNPAWGGYLDPVAMSPINDGSGSLFMSALSCPYYCETPYFWKILKTGSIDPTYNPGGSGFNAYPQVMAPLNDGSGDTYFGGNFSSYNYQITNSVARIGPSGQVR